MSTNYYLEKWCELGCKHRIHLGKTSGDGPPGLLFHLKIWRGEGDCSRCEVPFVVLDRDQLVEEVSRMRVAGWTLKDEYGYERSLPEMLEKVHRWTHHDYEFS